jgi:hypothetical protein
MLSKIRVSSPWFIYGHYSMFSIVWKEVGPKKRARAESNTVRTYKRMNGGMWLLFSAQ